MNKRISYQLEVGASHGERFNPDLGRGGGDITMPLCAALSWSPISKVYNEDGSYQLMDPLSSRMLNPVLMTTKESLRYSNNGSAVGNLRIKIIDGLVFDGKASMSFGTGGERNFIPEALNSGYADGWQNSYENRSWLVNSVLTYNTTLDEKHHTSFMVGFEQAQSQSRSFEAVAKALMIPNVGWDNLSLGRSYNMKSDFGNNAMRSYFGRVNYNYDSRYYFTGTYRIDGASKFVGKNRYSHFPSFAVAWRVSEETFLKNTDIFQNLKFRASWGITGSQAIDSYATITTMSSSYYHWGTGQPFVGYGPGAAGNPNLQWEETTTYDFGIDLSMLNGKLNVTFDSYYKKTDKLLSNMKIPQYNGGGNIATNIGNLENRGFEVNLNYVVFENRDWSYDINLNGAHNRNKVLDLGEEERIWAQGGISGVMPSPFVILPGEPIGTIYGYKYLGIWQIAHEKQAERYRQRPGNYRYEDLNDNGEFDAGDYQVIGCANPKFTWGFNNHFSWRNWDLNILVEGLHGRDVLNLTYCTVNNFFHNSLTVKGRRGKDRWSPENPNAEFQQASSNLFILANSDQYIQNGSYVKIRNISLARQFQISDIAKIRVAFSAQNLFTFTKYMGYDPEVSSHGASDTSSGLDWFAYPNPRTYSVSISLGF